MKNNDFNGTIIICLAFDHGMKKYHTKSELGRGTTHWGFVPLLGRKILPILYETKVS